MRSRGQRLAASSSGSAGGHDSILKLPSEKTYSTSTLLTRLSVSRQVQHARRRSLRTLFLEKEKNRCAVRTTPVPQKVFW